MDNIKKALNQSYDGNTTHIPTYWMVQQHEPYNKFAELVGETNI